MRDIGRDALIRARLHQQLLCGRTKRPPEHIVSWLGAVQSQDYAGAVWAIAQRSAGLTQADVDASFDAGAILRTHVMRPTWHFVAAADIRWLLTLTAPRVHAIGAPYLRRMDLTAGVLTRAHRVFERVLRDGRTLTRADLAAALKKNGIDATGARLALIVMNAELEAVICSGPRQGKQFTYALLDERAPEARPLSRDAALATLTERYFTSHGPATARDFAWWSGLTLTDVRAGIETATPALQEIVAGGVTYYASAGERFAHRPARTAFLLSNYDEFLIAYKDRGLSIRAPARPGGGMAAKNPIFAHQVVIDGYVTGSWNRSIGAKHATIEVRPYTRFSAAEMAQLRKAADAYGRFLGKRVGLL
jgi:hypothetical protein